MKQKAFRKPPAEGNVAYSDLIWVSENLPITMYREGDYPPLRGTLIGAGREAVLFTRGSVPVYRTYPGMRVLRPLMLPPTQTIRRLARLHASFWH